MLEVINLNLFKFCKDKNNKHLENEYNKLQDILNDHNGELKVMYSVSNESDHKKKFKFVKKLQ